MTILLEICVADAESLAAAIAGGADRIELCSALELGGLTPSPGLMRLAALSPVPVYAMVRPRTGDFVYAGADIDALLGDIASIREFGLAGVVLGASRVNGTLDTELLARLLDAASGLGSTLHRAIDLVPDLAAATEAAVQLGFERILTAGGAATGPEGLDGLRTILATARGRIGVMAGSGLNLDNIEALLDAVPLSQVHSSGAVTRPTLGTDAIRFGFAEATRRETDAGVVAALKAKLAAR